MPIHSPRGAFDTLYRGGTSILDLTPTVLESIARIDGAIVLDRTASLLAFGAILRHQLEPGLGENAVEGGRCVWEL